MRGVKGREGGGGGTRGELQVVGKEGLGCISSRESPYCTLFQSRGTLFPRMSNLLCFQFQWYNVGAARMKTNSKANSLLL